MSRATLSFARPPAEGRGEALASIAPILLPDDDTKRAGHAHRLVWLLFQDQPMPTRDFLWRDDGEGRYHDPFTASARPIRSDLFDLETKSFAPDLARGDESALRRCAPIRLSPARAHWRPETGPLASVASASTSSWTPWPSCRSQSGRGSAMPVPVWPDANGSMNRAPAMASTCSRSRRATIPGRRLRPRAAHPPQSRDDFGRRLRRSAADRRSGDFPGEARSRLRLRQGLRLRPHADPPRLISLLLTCPTCP